MTASKLYRVESFLASKAIKAPVATETTGAITLSGLQTINGVVLAEGDRVLVKDQADPVENGIYDVNVSAWTRSADWDGTRDATNGTLVVNGRSTTDPMYQLVTVDDPFEPGVSSATFNPWILDTLGSTDPGQGASLIGIEDDLSVFVATNVEDALQEVHADTITNLGKINNIEGATLTADKDADTTRQSTTLPTGDPDLSIPSVLQRKYDFEACLRFVPGSGSMGFRFQVVVITGSADDSVLDYQLIDSAGGGLVSASAYTIGAEKSFSLLGADLHILKLKGLIDVTSAVSTVEIRWAQGVSEATDLTLEKNSYIKLLAIT